jgi:predicted transcriptional regulator of viral defense system
MKRWVTVVVEGVTIKAVKSLGGWVIASMSDWSQAGALEKKGVIHKAVGGPYLVKEWAEKGER